MNRIGSELIEGLKRNNSSISSLLLGLWNADSEVEHAILNAYQENNSHVDAFVFGPHLPQNEGMGYRNMTNEILTPIRIYTPIKLEVLATRYSLLE